MPRRGRHSLVLTTTDSEEQAESLARGLVESRLAACVQVSHVTSHYIWKGSAERTPEWLLLIKTRSTGVAAITGWLAVHHSYETPEVVEIPIVSGLASYLAWIDDAVDAPPDAAGGRRLG